ncbi:MAG: hypothetical protein ACP5NL_03675 [Thermoplasmata archaeon]
MMMIEIPAILIYKRKIKGFGSVEELISSTSSKTLYLYDYDSFLGKEFNFKYYTDLGDIYKLWIEANLKKIRDLVDLLVAGGEIVVLDPKSKFYRKNDEILKYTDQVAIKLDDSVELKKYKLSGGKYIIYNKDLDDRELEVAKPVFLRGVIYDRAV